MVAKREGNTVGKQARSKSRELRQAMAVAERRRRNWTGVLAGGGGLIIVGLLVAIVVSLVNAAGPKDPRDAAPDSAKPMVTPTTATDRGAIAIGNANAPVRLEIYLDYLCPFCGRFERANGAELDRLVTDGTVRIELYPMSFLDEASDGTKYSTRAANAIATVADRAPGQVLAVNTALFARQPAEGSPGLSDDEIMTLAGNAGVPQDVVNLFRDGIFEPWVAASTTAAFESGVSGTPTIKINGKKFSADLYTVGPLTQAVTAAKGQ